MRHKIVITSGEPAGIGPDICLDLPTFNNTELYVIADPDLITDRARLLSSDLKLQIHKNTDALSDFYHADKLNIIPLALNTPCQAGTLNPDNSPYVLKMLDLAHDLCLQKKLTPWSPAPFKKALSTRPGSSLPGILNIWLKKQVQRR